MKQVQTQSIIKIDDLSVQFEQRKIFEDFSLSVSPGEVVTIFGPNGCGKSTLLNVIAGITSFSKGKVEVSETEVGYVFQNYRESLFPWRTNYENVCFPLEVAGFDPISISERIAEMEKIFAIPIPWSAYPYQLSGGQQQMLSFFRTLVMRPKLLLIDEPSSALDIENSVKLRTVLENYYQMAKPTILMVTHDIEEAVFLGTRILVLPRSPVGACEVIVNDRPYPRDIEYSVSDDFQSVKQKALSSFRHFTQI